MATDLIDFVNWIEPSGYHWVKATPSFPEKPRDQELRRYLCPKGEGDHPLRLIAALDLYPRSLFRKFSETELTSDGIISFANEFGLLGADITTNVVLKSFNDRAVLTGLGDPQEAWFSEIYAMRRAVMLWEAICENDGWILDQHVRIGKNGAEIVFEEDPPARYEVANNVYKREALERIRRGGKVTAARLGVKAIIDEHLYEPGRVGPTPLLNDRDDLESYFRPHGLIGAIWLDFMLVVTRKVDFRRCAFCDAPFAVAPKGKRRRFCSNKCRVAHHRATHAREERK